MTEHELSILAQDRVRITDAMQRDTREKLVTYSATAEEVREWYGTEDPLCEIQNEANINIYLGTDEEALMALMANDEYAIMNSVAHERACLTLLAHVIDPGIVGEEPNDWAAKMLEDDPTTRYISGEKADQVIKYLFPKLPTNPTPDQICDLYIALDSLNYAQRGYMNIYQDHIKSPDLNSQELFTYQKIFDKTETFGHALIYLSGYLQESGLANDDPVARKVGLQTGLFLASSNLELVKVGIRAGIRGFSKDVEAHSSASFKNITNVISRYFLSSPSAKVLKGEAKGLLHEALFTLDANFLLATEGHEFAEWSAVPVFPRLDSPTINYPELRRGFDITVNDGRRSIPTQLKSSANEIERPYHPSVYILQEENFQDVDVRRLQMRMRRYEQWIADPTNNELRESVRKTVLPTSLRLLERIQEVSGMSETDYLISRSPGVELDRNQRRRIARRMGELKPNNKKARRRQRDNR